MRPRILAATTAALLLTSCGYIGDPLPPLANVPVTVKDLAAIQRGGRIIAHFTVPQVPPKRSRFRRPLTLDLRAGPHRPSGSTKTSGHRTARHIRRRNWIGTDGHVRDSCRGMDREGNPDRGAGHGRKRQANWVVEFRGGAGSGSAGDARSEAGEHRAGVRLTWRRRGTSFRVFRKSKAASTRSSARWRHRSGPDAATEFGKRYSYEVQALRRSVTGSRPRAIFRSSSRLRRATCFPPAVPAGLHAEAAPTSIELNWDRNTEQDLAGYRVYRAEGDGAMEKIAEICADPELFRPQVESGKTYRYAVTAFDQAGNESARTAVVTVAHAIEPGAPLIHLYLVVYSVIQ